jgi:dihydrofolate reductase
MTIAIVVAMDEAGVIGWKGGLPWHLPDDLKWFKTITMGHVLILGRRTFESIGRRPLPGRTFIVLTRSPSYEVPAGVRVAPDLSAALRVAADVPRVFVVGGSSVYRAALPRTDELFVTRVHAQVEGDVRFPDVDWSAWTLVEEEHHPADARHAFSFTFQHFARGR